MRSPWASQPSLSGKRSTRTNRTPRFTYRRATRHMQANAADRSSGVVDATQGLRRLGLGRKIARLRGR